MKKDCWWNENTKSAKDTASLGTPATPTESTKTEPPITGMLIQSDEGGEIPADPTQRMYSVTKQESVPIANDFLIDFGAATSVCQQSLADSLGGKPRGPGVELRSATRHQFTTTGNTTVCLRTRDGVSVSERLSDRTQEHWTAEVDHLGGTSVRQRQYHHVPQYWWNDPQRVHRQST